MCCLVNLLNTLVINKKTISKLQLTYEITSTCCMLSLDIELRGCKTEHLFLLIM